MDEIYCIKLAGGDELIARLVPSEATDALCVKDVFTIGLQQVGPNEVGVGMMPWLVGDHKATVNIAYAHIVTTYKPNSQLEQAYRQKTTTIALI